MCIIKSHIDYSYDYEIIGKSDEWEMKVVSEIQNLCLANVVIESAYLKWNDMLLYQIYHHKEIDITI